MRSRLCTVLSFLVLVAACTTGEEGAGETLDGTMKPVMHGRLTIDTAGVEITDDGIHLWMDLCNDGTDTAAINGFWWHISSFLVKGVMYGIDDSCIGNLMFVTKDTACGYMSTTILIPPKQSRLSFEVVGPNERKRLTVDLPLSRRMDDIATRNGCIHVSIPYWKVSSVPKNMYSDTTVLFSEINGRSASELDVYVRSGVPNDQKEVQNLITSLQGRATFMIGME